MSKKKDLVMLHSAISSGNIAEVRNYIQNGGDINAFDEHGFNPLYFAVMSENMEIIEFLIRSGASVNTPYFHPLLLAAVKGNIALISLLLEHGCAINSVDEDGWSALHFCVYGGQGKAAEFLVGIGADTALPDKTLATPMHLAAELHPGILKVFVRESQDLNIADINGWTSVFYAVDKNVIDSLQILLHAGADPNIPTKGNVSPIYRACERGDEEIVKLLIKYGANISGRKIVHSPRSHPTYSKPSASPIFACLFQSHMNCLKILIEAGANLDACLADDITPLHVATFQEDTVTMKLLLDKGASIRALNTNGESALHLAVKTGNIDVVNVLLSSLNAEEIINYQDMDGWTALNIAVYKHDIPMVERLLSFSSVDVNTASNEGSPLANAVWGREIDIVKMLMERGAVVDDQTIVAATKASVEMVNLVFSVTNVKTTAN